MSELKLVIENDTENASMTKPDVATLNPFDALNRRDIELIKKSLANMHKDSADLRTTLVALYQRNNRVPSKGFFISLGFLLFIGVGLLTAARPQLDAALHRVPVFAKLSNGETP